MYWRTKDMKAAKVERSDSRERESKYYAVVDQQRNGAPKLLVLSMELLFAVGFDLLRRFAKSWCASLKSNVTHREFSKTKHPTGIESNSSVPSVDQGQERGPGTRGKSSRRSAVPIFDLFKNAAKEWSQDQCPQLGAALAYYTVFSLAPLMLVLLAVFGLIYGGNEPAREKILGQLRYLLDPSALKVIQDIAKNAAQPKAGILSATIGVLIALFGASGIFGQLQTALNTIWDVKAKPGQGIWGFIRARFLSFGMVSGVCFLLLVSLTVENLLRALHNYLQSMIPGGHYLGLAAFYLFDIAIIIVMFAMIFRFLPDAKIAWRDVWTGAALTAILFVGGKLLLGLYLGSGAAGSAYGAAGSLVTLLLWVFYSAQILLFGAEFTKIYANTCGSRVVPEPHAVRVERREIEISENQ